MAHQLIGSKIQFGQTLHGYSDGHRLLSSSITLKSKDLKTMLIMSDASGSGSLVSAEGYLTGYPLPDSGVYALGRTWPATDISRPGCVWTHTILVDFEDLARLSQMGFLNNYFRRPIELTDTTSYGTPVEAEIQTGALALDAADRELVMRIMAALYGHPKEKIVASGSPRSIELVMSVWAQQWPRLRRSFRFCTLAFADRSLPSAHFDLQFIPADNRTIRSRFSSAVDANRLTVPEAPWISIALQDLLGRANNLRGFLRHVGGDVTSGREAFAPLCRLYQLLPNVAEDVQAINEAWDLLQSRFQGDSGDSARKLVVSTVINNAQVIHEDLAESLLNHLDLFTEDDLHLVAPKLGYEIWAREPNALLAMLDAPPLKSLIAEEALARMSVDHLIAGAQIDPQTIATLIKKRPELLTSETLWTLGGSWQDEALAVAPHNPDLAQSVLTTIIKANRTDLATQVVRSYGSATVLSVLQTLSEKLSSGHLGIWLTASVVDPHKVAQFLCSEFTLDIRFLLAIAQHSYPDFVRNKYGEDPWWTATKKVQVDLPDHDQQYLSAYLLARALGYQSRSQAELIRLSFDDVYFPMAESRLSEEAWRLLDPRLPRHWAWLFDWDSCQRLLDAVAAVFVDRELSPVPFTQITKHDHVFRRLAKTVAETNRGRRFLRKAIKALNSHNHLSERLETMQKLT